MTMLKDSPTIYTMYKKCDICDYDTGEVLAIIRDTLDFSFDSLEPKLRESELVTYDLSDKDNLTIFIRFV